MIIYINNSVLHLIGEPAIMGNPVVNAQKAVIKIGDILYFTDGSVSDILNFVNSENTCTMDYAIYSVLLNGTCRRHSVTTTGKIQPEYIDTTGVYLAGSGYRTLHAALELTDYDLTKAMAIAGNNVNVLKPTTPVYVYDLPKLPDVVQPREIIHPEAVTMPPSVKKPHNKGTKT